MVACTAAVTYINLQSENLHCSLGRARLLGNLEFKTNNSLPHMAADELAPCSVNRRLQIYDPVPDWLGLQASTFLCHTLNAGAYAFRDHQPTGLKRF